MMYKNITGPAGLLAILSGVTGTTAIAQELASSARASRPDFRVGINPLSFILGDYGLEVGAEIDPYTVIGGRAIYKSRQTFKEDLWIKGSAFGMSANYFFKGVRSDSFYAGGSYDFDMLKFGANAGYRLASGDDSVSLNRHALSAMGGYQWVWDNGLSAGLGAGVSYATFSGSKKNYDFSRISSSRSVVETLSYSPKRGFVPAAELLVSYTI